ncbi:HbrB-like-domain-containing protein [Macrophomina phaseolina]|uniref:HbrB-like-domain-containing protein n=1 Tax=Macrophomina phaseolina TaxID=35725 RepID=A0ABQ8GNX8_9PEZI|nr:HbrB-like-domain-containing protein [Macrophomina phaseolina]
MAAAWVERGLRACCAGECGAWCEAWCARRPPPPTAPAATPPTTTTAPTATATRRASPPSSSARSRPARRPPTTTRPPPATARSCTGPPSPTCPAMPPGVQTPPSHLGHRPRQHSQGFFEPSLPTASHSNSPSMSSLSASQIAAQAAMHAQQQDNQHHRKRSTTIPEPGQNNQPGRRNPSSPSPAVPSLSTNSALGVPTHYQNGVPGGQKVAATAAANTVFPRSPLASPSPEYNTRPMSPQVMPEKEVKPVKEKSKMKLFSKPKSIGISRDKDPDKRLPALPSPNRPGMYSTSALPMNQSTTSLIDHKMPAPSIYSLANASTSTLVPSDRLPMLPEKEKEKEKHRHHFLSRQKHKLKHDDHSLPLSSASSNSKPTDPNAPQPLYNFAAPNSPGHSSTFAQSMSGLDLRHGGRALRQKKKEEKAANAHAASLENMDTPYRERDGSLQLERSDWPGTSALSTSAPSNALLSSSALALDTPQTSVANLGAVFGVPGMTPDDAWPLIKARVLLIFEGEDPRPPIEDFNALVSVHIRRCIQRQAPTVIIEDIGELLQTGFLSLDQTLRHCPDDRLVPKLVDMWTVVLYTILPFVQAVFLPLDMEFKGKGIMNPKEAAGFWGASLPNRNRADSDESRSKNFPTLGEDLDVRRLTLLAFRDIIILPRNDALMAIFSRLSLENINAGIVDSHPSPDATTQFSHQTSPAAHAVRPGTSTSLASNILESTSTSFSNPFTSNSRSRATSNTSAGSFHSLPSNVHLAGHGRSHSNPQNYYSHQLAPPPPPPPMDTAKVMETVARMLQCVSILISIRSGDDAQAKMEKLAAELKYNWFGRGRTGRNRRGFVGRKGASLGTLVRVGEGD